ncbi:VOC family protein [Silvimonas iriomotensis]|uniref:Glyoxalase n=1 Tax=Silvimonas iriomotensis TaxID=449662 RepID=A0ABQ2PDJ8_9NEIS|nr:VOC family protein [Silvimonas iriomotensis]GGP23234.1 glyoxalase [Silvimonas iriomotensis]
MDTIQNPFCWTEIAVADMERAVRFYEAVFNTHLKRERFGDSDQAIFPHAEDQPGGALFKAAHMQPGASGTRAYLNVGTEKLDTVLGRVERAGGKMDFPVVFLGDCIGYIAGMVDSEGNRVGLFSHAG